MSSAWSMATVTVILKTLLENALVEQAGVTGLGEVMVSALPPDRITVGAEERPQLNLYLYHLTPNSGWRQAQPAHQGAREPEQRPGTELPLKLHYLLTAYGERDGQAELLLGAAMACFQQVSPLKKERLQATLAALTATGGRYEWGSARALAQLLTLAPPEEIRIRPEFLSLEELTRLWSSWQAHARLAMAYEVTIVAGASPAPVSQVAARAVR
jgi:hypothetical protein